MNSISTNYHELAPADVERVAQECASAWKDPAIPRRQYDLAVKNELEALRQGKACPPFAALGKCLRKMPVGIAAMRPRLLDVGASAGYYSEVLRLMHFRCEYQAIDFSPAFKALAQELYPGIAFDIGDARALPYGNDSFPIVLNGATLMHTLDYPLVIAETARVASRFVLFHRTPVLATRATTFFEKDAYGIRCLEIHFNEAELLERFSENALELLHTECVFWNAEEHFGHRTYLLRKVSLGEREWERA